MPLLIHTGGTIGMIPGPDGLHPAPGLVEAAVGDRVQVVAFDPLLDSADLNHAHWNRMLDLIEAAGSAVIITHGTDTMAYSGAALAQALAGWPHPVVLTGAMHPLGSGGDAEGNLALALDLALSSDAPPGVWLAFAGRKLAADLLVKSDSRGEDAFRSLADVPDATPPQWQSRRFADRRLAILTLSPGIPPAVIAAALDQLDGAVLRVFGAGTIPGDPGLAEVLARASAAGKLLRAVTACENGGLEPGAYAAGRNLWAAGVQNGGSDTAEAALIRLWLQLSE